MENKEDHTSLMDEVNLTAIADKVNDFKDTLSPADKKAEAEKQASVVLNNAPSLKAKAHMQNDQGTNDSQTIASAIAAAEAKPVKSQVQPQETIPGAYTSEKKDTSVGWSAFSKLPNPGDEAAISELSTQLGLDTVISMYKGSRTSAIDENDLTTKFLNEAYYGEWYHNAAVMLFSVVFTWLLTRFGGGIYACLVIGAFLATYYQTSIRRLRRNIRDDIQRELAINRLETETESADWINHFMSRFWLIYEPVLSAQIIGIADSILVDNTPAFLDSIRLTTFTLGTKAPRIEGIKTITKTEPNVVCMDWKFSFVPNDTLDLTERDLQSKVNPKIVLTIRVGKGMIGAGIPVLLEDLAFSGHLRLKFKMFNEFPHIKTVEASFLEKPHFDYSLKPVGGETFGFDINNIPGLESFVQEQVHATLGPMMYAPNVFTLDVAGMMSGATDLNSANGVLVLKIHSATGLKDVDLFGTIDPYITIHVGNSNNAELGRTKCVEDSKNPRFDETLFVLLNTVNETLVLELMDRNVGRTDSSLGTCIFDLKTLADSDNVVEGLSLPVLKKGKTCGEVKCDLQYFPVNAPTKQDDGTVVPAVESNSGVLRFAVHECKELGGQQKSGGGIAGLNIPVIGGKGDISAYAVVKMNDIERLRTNPFKRSINPRWDKNVELFVTDKSALNLRVDVLDANNDDKLLGRWNSTLEEFEEDLLINGQDWWNLKEGSGKIHLSMQWKPISMTGFVESFSRGGYREPIGVVRVNFESANDLKNVEAMTGGKSDPYVRVMSGVQVRGQTERIDDNLDPVWNEVLYIPVHSKREDLIFEVMDYNENSKDKSLGITDFFLKDVMRESKTEDGQIIYEGTETVQRQVDLVSLERKKGRGTLKYSASFFPTLALAKEDEAKKNEQQQEEDTNNSQASEEPELIEKPKELPEKDLHGEPIKYKTVSDKKQIDLLAYESGVLAVTMHSLTLPESQRAVVDLMLDSNFAQYTSVEQKGSRFEINETGTAFVKEMEFSKLIVKVRNVRDGDNDDKYIGRYTIGVRSIVQRLVEAAANQDGNNKEPIIEEYSLLECNGGKISLSFNFIPVVQFKLDPAESLENQGILTVTAIKANNLVAADRSGTSDPFVRFYVNDERVFKTQTYKKTCNPVFTKEETFDCSIVNRINTPLVVKIFDWDQIGKDTQIGECKVTFTSDDLETRVASTKEYKLDQGGTITLRLVWRPELVARKRTNTSFFSATTRVFTSAPGNAFGAGRDAVGAGGKVLGAGGKAIGSGVSAIGSGILGIGRMGKKSPTISEENNSLSRTDSIASSTVSSVQNTTANNDSNTNISPSSSTVQQTRSIGEENATIQVELLGARNLKAMDRGGTSDPYCRVRFGNKVLHKTRHLKKTLSPEWNESFSAKVNSNGTLDFKVKDHNTLSDVDIGDCQLNLANVVKPGQPYDGWLALAPEGTGEIHVKISFADSDSASTTSKSGGLFGKK
ncbi:C2 domain-containing protein [Choanephora cucurbitarum]|nr:C2 domain-containing protein [Choanephora cucurbitarum]